MRRARSWALGTLVGFASISLLFGSAEAAPAVPTLSVSPTTLTPFISGGCATITACYDAKGHTDPSAKVWVVVTDEFGGSVTVSTWAAERSDPGTGVVAGDYVIAPNVTALGTHDPTPSTLTFVAYAEVAGVKSGLSAPFAVTKLATMAGDVNPPEILIQGQRVSGFICGTGYCSFSTCALASANGAVPQPVRSFTGLFTGYKGCTGTYKMTGSIEDNNSKAFGIASEVTDLVLTTKDSAGNVVEIEHGLGTRRGTQGFWAVSIVVDKYAVGQSYTWSLVAADAAGNASTPLTGTFTRAPL